MQAMLAIVDMHLQLVRPTSQAASICCTQFYYLSIADAHKQTCKHQGHLISIPWCLRRYVTYGMISACIFKTFVILSCRKPRVQRCAMYTHSLYLYDSVQCWREKSTNIDIVHV